MNLALGAFCKQDVYSLGFDIILHDSCMNVTSTVMNTTAVVEMEADLGM